MVLKGVLESLQTQWGKASVVAHGAVQGQKRGKKIEEGRSSMETTADVWTVEDS